MQASTLSTLSAIIALAGLAQSRVVPVQSRQILYCGGAEEPTIATGGDPEDGPGIWVTNNDNDPNVQYFIYENSRDEHPWKYLDVPQGTRAFVQVCPTFQGRIVRGAAGGAGPGHRGPGTWVEVSLSGGGVAWGDVSFLEGCDGGARIAAADGSGLARACTAADLLSGAPAGAIASSPAGNRVLAAVVGPAANQAAKAWLGVACDVDQVYVQEPTQAVISSANGRFEIAFVGGVS